MSTSDILGPADAPNFTTERPADDRTIGTTDTWMKDCSAPNVNDGTKLRAALFNSLIGNLRGLVRGNGNTDAGPAVVTEDNADDMLLRGVRHLIQRGQSLYAVDSGTADALVATLSPAPPEYKSGAVWRVKKISSANSIATPTINFNGLGEKTIVDRRGQTLAPGDLPADAELELLFDGTNFRTLGIVSADLGVIGTLRNVKQFATSTRVSMSGSSGNSYTVTPWSPGNYTKQSATSLLVVLATFPTYTPGASGSTSAILNVGGTSLQFIPSNNNSSLSFGQGTLIQTVSGIADGALALSVSFKRSDSAAWTGIFCFNNTENAQYPSATTATIIVGELGI